MGDLATAQHVLVTLHSASESSATVNIVAAQHIPSTPYSTFRVYHLSDSHITLDVESWRQERVALGLEPDDPIAAAYMHPKWDGEDPIALFEAQLAEAVEQKADLLIHTGDFLNVPCKETIAHVTAMLDQSGLDYLFTCGNHDWCERSVFAVG